VFPPRELSPRLSAGEGSGIFVVATLRGSILEGSRRKPGVIGIDKGAYARHFSPFNAPKRYMERHEIRITPVLAASAWLSGHAPMHFPRRSASAWSKGKVHATFAARLDHGSRNFPSREISRGFRGRTRKRGRDLEITASRFSIIEKLTSQERERGREGEDGSVGDPSAKPAFRRFHGEAQWSSNPCLFRSL